MTRFVALLRAINAGKGSRIKMKPLQQVFESLGFSNVSTFAAAGNLVFETKGGNIKSIQRRIEKGLQETLGYAVDALIRTSAQMARIADSKPFSQTKIESAAEFNIIFLSDRLNQKLIRELMALQTETDEFRIDGREIFWLRGRKKGGSNLSTVPFDKFLPRPFTMRSAGTIQKLASKSHSDKP